MFAVCFKDAVKGIGKGVGKTSGNGVWKGMRTLAFRDYKIRSNKASAL